MSLVNQQIRALAERVAASHGLEIVEVAFGGAGKHRTLSIFLERNAAGRAALQQRLEHLRENGAENGSSASGITLDLVEAGEQAGLSAEEDDLAYLRDLPQGVPAAQLSGVTHGDCERFSRDFGVVLDIEDLVPGAEYMLEVSSPGLDRKLSRREDFERFRGQLCKVQCFTPVFGNRHWQGHLAEVTGEMVKLKPLPGKAAKKGKKASTTEASSVVEIALGNIEKAQLVPEF